MFQVHVRSVSSKCWAVLSFVTEIYLSKITGYLLVTSILVCLISNLAELQFQLVRIAAQLEKGLFKSLNEAPSEVLVRRWWKLEIKRVDVDTFTERS